jgi:hypothetical protein
MHKPVGRVAPGQGASLSDIELVWGFSDIDVIWGGVDVDTYLLFTDGSAYKDCAIPPDELNVSALKSQQPKKWTHWRNNGWRHTELFFYEKRRGEFNLVYGNDLDWLDD